MPNYKYKTKTRVTDVDTARYLCRIDGEIMEKGVPLVYSREVTLAPWKRREKRGPIYSSEDSAHNKASARRNEKTGRTLEKGIHLYRLWFRFLKLGLELEAMNVEMVVENETWVKDHTNPDIPQSVLDQSEKERREEFERTGKTAGHFTGRYSQIFRCKVHKKIKVKRSAYKGWDLDKVLTQSFDEWWVDHSYLFEGHMPKILSSKDEWVDNPDFIYVRFDRTAQVRDVREFLRTHLSKEIKAKRATFTISGKNPRVNTIQNNYNALVLLLRGWTPKDICTADKIYLRRTDEVEPLDGKGRTQGDRLTIPRDRKTGKELYSTLVSRQREQGIFHLLEVCEGRFGMVLKS
jgi:hypothetical protein